MKTSNDIIHLKGERYSPNLLQWLRYQARRYGQENFKVFRSELGDLFIGYKDCEGSFTGARLTSVTCHGWRAGRVHYGKRRMVELKTFWNRYARIGVCAIDEEHYHYSNRWDLVSPRRRCCRWCGLKQGSKSVVTINRSHVWNTLP